MFIFLSHLLRVLIFLLIIFKYSQMTFAVLDNSIIISEVVIANTSAKDEFIEIYNTSNQEIDLQALEFSLHIRNSSGEKDINKTLKWNQTTIPAHGYFLFVSKESDTYKNIADAFYTADLVKNGAVYISFSSKKRTDIIDFISWGSHQNPEAIMQSIIPNTLNGQSIERDRESFSENIYRINNTPSPRNSIIKDSLELSEEPVVIDNEVSEQAEEPLAIDDESSEPEEPLLIDDEVLEQEEPLVIDGEVSEQAEEPLVIDDEVLEQEELVVIDDEVSEQAEEPLVIDSEVLEQEEPLVIDDEAPEQEEPLVIDGEVPEQAEETLVLDDERGETGDVIISLNQNIWISEVFPKPQKGDFEWIELYNDSNEVFQAQGSQLCVRDACVILQENIPAKSYTILTENIIENFEGPWPPLINTSADILWKQNNTEAIIDTFIYHDAKVHHSFIKNTKESLVTRTQHITKGKENTFNTPPIAVIRVQGDKKTFGYAPFSINFTGEDSYDNENDSLQFSWFFGNTEVSDKENPVSIRYQNEGHYIIKLEVRDSFGAISYAQEEIIIAPEPKIIIQKQEILTPTIRTTNSSSSSSSSSSVNMNTLEPVALYFSEVSVNNKKNDFIKIECFRCKSDVSLYGYSLYDDKVFFSFSKNDILKQGESLIVMFDKNLSLAKKDNTYYIPRTGLTKTDEQVMLLYNEDILTDAICWNNFDTTFSQSEKKDEQRVLDSFFWKGSCIHSEPLKNKNALLVKINNSNTSSASDWEIQIPDGTCKESHCALKKKESPQDATAKKILEKEYLQGIIISEFIPNPQGDDALFEWIEMKNTLDTEVSLYHWVIQTKSKKYVFPKLILQPQEFYLLKRPRSKVSLVNKNGWILLKNPQGDIIQNISYRDTFESASYGMNNKNIFQWSSLMSPLKDNIFFPLEEKPQDSDKDGLSDFIEDILGTNLKSSDSDGDKISDKFEIENGLDPLNNNVNDVKKFQKYLLESSDASIQVPETKDERLMLRGQVRPFAKIKILVHSKPHYFLTQANNKGVWKYDIPKLEKGDHHYQYQVFDKGGIASDFSQPVAFHLENAIQLKKKKPQSKEVARDVFKEKIQKRKNEVLFIAEAPVKDFKDKVKDISVEDHSDVFTPPVLIVKQPSNKEEVLNEQEVLDFNDSPLPEIDEPLLKQDSLLVIEDNTNTLYYQGLFLFSCFFFIAFLIFKRM
jgi:PKD repeat protein